MEHKNNPTLTPRARQLRKTMTKEERKLWYDFLRAYPLHIYRQRTIGKYIADFYCPAASLVIELDGSQHCEPAAQLRRCPHRLPRLPRPPRPPHPQ